MMLSKKVMCILPIFLACNLMGTVCQWWGMCNALIPSSRSAFLWIIAVELIFKHNRARLDLEQRTRRLGRVCWSLPYSCLCLESVQLTVPWALNVRTSLFIRTNSSCPSSNLRSYQHVLLNWTFSRTTAWHLVWILTELTKRINPFSTIWCVFSFDQYFQASGSFFLICEHDLARLRWSCMEYYSFWVELIYFRWSGRESLYSFLI